MNLDELLGIDPTDPRERNAEALVLADDKLLQELIALREYRNLTQERLGKLMGISQGAVARIEAGDRDPRLSTLRRYALAVEAVVEHTVEPREDFLKREDAFAASPSRHSDLYKWSGLKDSMLEKHYEAKLTATSKERV